MTEAKKILELIENIRPDHHGDITSFVPIIKEWVIKNIDLEIYQRALDNFWGAIPLRFRNCAPDWDFLVFLFSRDALKAMRPEGWHIFIYHFTIGFKAELSRDRASMKPILTKQIKHLPTEELAELHAIIQAREYERLEK